MLINSKFKKQLFHIMWLIFIILVIDAFVYFSGGTKFAFTHLMYIPVIMGAYFYGLRGGLIVAIVSSLSLGPFMPMDVENVVLQNTDTWLLRMYIFMIMGSLVGSLFDHIHRNNEMMKDRAYKNMTTGQPNLMKLQNDLQKMIDEAKMPYFSMMIYKIQNINDINRHLNYSVGEKVLRELIEHAIISFSNNSIYSVYNNQIVVLLSHRNVKETHDLGCQFLDQYKNAIFIDKMPVNVVLKGGIVNYPEHGNNSHDLIQYLDRSLYQAETSEVDLAIYSQEIAQKHIECYHTLTSTYQAIENERFTLVFQPKVQLCTNEIIGFETLLRLQDDVGKNINITNIIQTAEDAGFISEISKWVIKNAIQQLKIWRDEDLEVNISINLSHKDLKDNSIIEYTKLHLKENNIDSSTIEFELTERGLLYSEDQALEILNEIKEMGSKISLDDYGVGYNCLMNIVKLPLDYIKIDKSIIDNILNEQGKSLVQDVIKLVHNLGKEVIAEGVETKDQYDILKDIGCDVIQGYYISRPMESLKIKEFIESYNKTLWSTISEMNV